MEKNKRPKPLFVIQCYEDRQPTLPLRKAEHFPSEPATNGHSQTKRDATDPPPPPPPMPPVNGYQNGDHTYVEDQKPVLKRLGSELVNNLNLRQNGTLIRTPTPDYNNSKPEIIPVKLKSIKDEKVDLESLESFKLKNPSNVQPKPPSNYFMRAPNGTATMKKHGRPVSVTIGEYASGGGGRREPSKLDFLNGDKPDGQHVPDDVSISNRLQSELALTLSRSNLRKKTEAVDRASIITLVKKDNDTSVDNIFHARYGNNLLPLPPSITIPKVAKLKH